MKLVIDWGAGFTGGNANFLLKPQSNPVRLRLIAAADRWQWLNDSIGTPLGPVAWTPGSTTVAFDLPNGDTYLRFDFYLYVTIRRLSDDVLSITQLYRATPPERGLIPDEFRLPEYSYASQTSPPGVSRTMAPLHTQSRGFTGGHPLLSTPPLTDTTIKVNAEFVDVTELWWSVHPDRVMGWYLDPVLGGRVESLRVLAWTLGSPMIWFAAVPDVVKEPKSTDKEKDASASAPHEKIGALVFYRPPPNLGFTYGTDEAGFTDPQHDEKSLRTMARYLLSPVPPSKVNAVQKINSWDFLLDAIAPTKRDSANNAEEPKDPMDSNVDQLFIPVGIENAMQRAGVSRVVFLPQGTPQYGGFTTKTGLAERLRNALAVLWTRNLVNTSSSQAAQFERYVWIAGHSAGNIALGETLSASAPDIERVISFDAAGRADLGTVLAPIIKGAVARIKQVDNKRELDVFVIQTLNASNSWDTPLRKDTIEAMRECRARVTYLPSIKSEDEKLKSGEAIFWTMPPTYASNPWLRYVLNAWTKEQLEASVRISKTTKRPPLQSWFFLFLHEFAVYGGEKLTPPNDKQPDPTGIVSFFERALGKPDPE